MNCDLSPKRINKFTTRHTSQRTDNDNCTPVQGEQNIMFEKCELCLCYIERNSSAQNITLNFKMAYSFKACKMMCDRFSYYRFKLTIEKLFKS